MRDPDELFERVPRLINVQTKFLGRVPADAPHVEREALSEAKGLIDHLAFGVTEAFDTSVALFVERFRLRVPKFDIRNAAWATGDDDLQSAEFRAAARRNNELDVELYNYASTLLNSRVQRFTGNLLGLDAHDAAAACGALRFRGRPVENHIALPIGETSGRLSGWILVDGRAADAVLVRAGERLTPVAPAVERDDAARLTQDIGNRFAGFLGTIAIPADARALEIIAFDRARGRRAAHRLEITRTAAKPPLERSAAAARARIAKALRRK